MHADTPLIHSLVPRGDRPWLPPVRYGKRPYADFCQSLDAALSELVARYPSHRPLLTLEGRQKLLRRKPK